MHAMAGTGRVIAGRYRLKGPIGRGAMGTVWRAWDEVLDREVAVKELRISDGLPPDERAKAYQRTHREARTAARLSHPGLVTVFDVAEEDGRPWIIMELVPARSLDQIIAHDGPLPPERAADAGRQLLAALATAHAAGVLHRDVKPSNVLLADGGRAVLTDFGIATFQGDPKLTQTGMVMGSPGFTAPERIQGNPATPASDLWSLGATLYAAVEGHGPFDRAGGAITTMSAIINSDPPSAPSAAGLGTVIDALLRRNPADRPDAATAARMLGAVGPLAGATGRGNAFMPFGPRRPEPGTQSVAEAGPPGGLSPAVPGGPRVPPPWASDEPAAGTPGAPGRPAPGSPSAPAPSPASSQIPAPARGQTSGPGDGQTSGPGDGQIAGSGDGWSRAAEGSVIEAPPGQRPGTEARPNAPGPGPTSVDMPAQGGQTMPVDVSSALRAPTDQAANHPAADYPAANHLAAETDDRAAKDATGLPGAPGQSWGSPLAGSIGQPQEPASAGNASQWWGAAPAGSAGSWGVVPPGRAGQPPDAAAAWGAAPAPAGTPPGGAASATQAARRPRRTALVWVGVLVLVVVAAAGVLAFRAHHRTGAGTTANNQTGSAASSTTTESPAAAAAGPASTGTPPAGYHFVKEPAATLGSTAGFMVAVPDTWKVITRGTGVVAEAPSGSTFLQIDLTPHTYANMLVEARYLAGLTQQQGKFPGYAGLGIRAVDIRGGRGAAWGFTWQSPSAGQVRVLDLMYIASTPAGRQSFAVYMSSPATAWNGNVAAFDEAMRTFRPIP
jgi:eukaryotic-like serine/threonine-protein kinase